MDDRVERRFVPEPECKICLSCLLHHRSPRKGGSKYFSLLMDRGNTQGGKNQRLLTLSSNSVSRSARTLSCAQYRVQVPLGSVRTVACLLESALVANGRTTVEEMRKFLPGEPPCFQILCTVPLLRTVPLGKRARQRKDYVQYHSHINDK